MGNAVKQRSMHHCKPEKRVGEGVTTEPELVGVAGVMGNGIWCQGSRTWHVEDGVALVHGEHVGARASVDAGVLRLDVLDCQDAVEVHGTVRELPVALPGPDQSVGWKLALRSADKADCRSHPHCLGFRLLDCHLNGFRSNTCDDDLGSAPVGAALISAGAHVNAGIIRLDTGEVQLCSLSTSVSAAGDGTSILSGPVEIVRRRAGHLTPQSDRPTLGCQDPLGINLHHQGGCSVIWTTLLSLLRVSNITGSTTFTVLSRVSRLTGGTLVTSVTEALTGRGELVVWVSVRAGAWLAVLRSANSGVTEEAGRALLTQLALSVVQAARADAGFRVAGVRVAVAFTELAVTEI